MNKTIKLSIVCFFLIIHLLVSAQKDFQNGYIITNEKDTLIGLVKDRKEPPFGKLYDKVIFKKGRKKKKYGPNDISAYKKGNNLFESLWIEDSTYPFQGKYLGSPATGSKRFLKVIAKGYLSYYHWEFEDSESDYIDAIGLFKRENEDSFARVAQGIFGLKKKYLAKYFKDCQDLVAKIEEGEIKDPEEIVIFYNLWKESD